MHNFKQFHAIEPKTELSQEMWGKRNVHSLMQQRIIHAQKKKVFENGKLKGFSCLSRHLSQA